jgi:hypothetical protein
MGILTDGLDELRDENKSLRAAITAWVSAKDAEAAYHAAHGDGFVSHDEATVLAMEAAIDAAEEGLRAVVAGGG